MFNTLLNNSHFFSRLMTTLLIALAISSQTLAESGTESAVKTAFLYNFFKFIEWPETLARQNAYILCTTNNDILAGSLSVLKNKTIGSKPMVIRRGINGQDLKNCHMVFIGSSENAASTIQELKGLPVVTVSDKPDFVDLGGMIGLVPGENRLGFEINLDKANAGNVHISIQLIKLAKRVITAK